MHHASRFGDEFFSTAEVILECHLVNAAENQNSRTWAPKVRPSPGALYREIPTDRAGWVCVSERNKVRKCNFLNRCYFFVFLSHPATTS